MSNYNDEEYLKSLKQDDSYHFTIPFEYIIKNHGDDTYDIGTTYMEVDVEWDDIELGYAISYFVPEMDQINPEEGNGDEDEFYESWVESVVLGRLESMGITSEALISGRGF